MTGIKGPVGSQGAIGPTGAQGPDGLRGATGLKGIQGPHGPQGVRGEPGISGVEIATIVSASSSDDKSETVTCDVGKKLSAISGGARLSGSTGDNVAIVETRPTGVPGEVPSAWMAKAVEVNANSGSWVLTVYAVCAKVN